MKFSSLKILGKIKTDNDLNIGRKLKVTVSLRLLITYNTLSYIQHFIAAASPVLSMEWTPNLLCLQHSLCLHQPPDLHIYESHKDSGLPQPSTSMANTNAVLCFVLLSPGSGRGLVWLRTWVRNKDSHYRTVFSVRASGSSLPDHDHPFRWEGLGEFRVQRSRVQVTSTPRLTEQTQLQRTCLWVCFTSWACSWSCGPLQVLSGPAPTTAPIPSDFYPFSCLTPLEPGLLFPWSFPSDSGHALSALLPITLPHTVRCGQGSSVLVTSVLVSATEWASGQRARPGTALGGQALIQ